MPTITSSPPYELKAMMMMMRMRMRMMMKSGTFVEQRGVTFNRFYRRRFMGLLLYKAGNMMAMMMMTII